MFSILMSIINLITNTFDEVNQCSQLNAALQSQRRYKLFSIGNLILCIQMLQLINLFLAIKGI